MNGTNSKMARRVFLKNLRFIILRIMRDAKLQRRYMIMLLMR